MEYDDYNYSYYSYSDPWEPEDYYSSPPLLRTVLMSLAITTALLANILLLVVLCSSPRSLGTTSNVIFLQRAIADLLSAIAMVFFTAGTAGANIMRTAGTCLSFSVMMHVGTMASTVFLIAFTVDSYLAAYPQHHPRPSRRKTMRLTSALAWALAAATGIAAIFLSVVLMGHCFTGPFLSHLEIYFKAVEMFIRFLVPIIVSWVLVSVALPPRSCSFSAEAQDAGETGPNRSLMLGLTSTFTVTYGLYWIFEIAVFFGYLSGWLINLYHIIMTLPTFSESVNPILVLYLSEDLRQKVAGWLPSRHHSASLPLGKL